MMEKGERSMPTGIQSRTQFLVLAEFCQKVISSLLDYINGRDHLQRNILQEALGALKSVQSGDPYHFGQRSAAALSSYEEVRTLEEAWKQEQIDDAVRLTTELLAEPERDPSKNAKAKEPLSSPSFKPRRFGISNSRNERRPRISGSYAKPSREPDPRGLVSFPSSRFR
jgi:hypothetical protein